MTIAQIETQVRSLVVKGFSNSFFFDLLLAFGRPKASIARLQKGNLNLSKAENEILWKKRLYSRIVKKGEVNTEFEEMKGNTKALTHEPRFLAATDLENLKAFDTKTKESLSIPLSDLTKEYAFFLPWAGMEKVVHQNENLADVKAAERMGKLYDEIRKDNPIQTKSEIHELNVFLSRLLFCYFAEDTDIFAKGLFTNAVSSYTQPDGSDLHEFLQSLFKILNTESRKDVPAHLAAFPFVNGGLFRDEIRIPQFSAKSRAKLIEAGEDDWSVINPDIFGSMIQAVVDPSQRGSLGMHYTSVPNIMKVIEPLFLNELREEFEKARLNGPKLNKLLGRMGKIKIFDPACGSGNFLIIAYKELRKLEMQILEDLQTLYRYASGFEKPQLELIARPQLSIGSVVQPSLFSTIQLSQFYGIEIDDFAHEIAILSLWLAQHQMNVAFKEAFGSANPSLPLKEGGNIVAGNATRLDWEEVCPKKQGDEIYILGNPPYLGYSLQSPEQKADLSLTFGKKIPSKTMDYIAAWFFKASIFIKGFNSKFALVSTNSICQGEQVAALWPFVLGDWGEIFFAHTSFKWGNNAKAQAGVTCIIVGVRNQSFEPKYIFRGGIRQSTSIINSYLTSARNFYLEKRSSPLSNLQPILRGSGLTDDGNFVFSQTEKNFLISRYPNASKFFFKLIGSYELINKSERWGIYIDDNNLEEASSIPEIEKRLNAISNFRLKSKKGSTIESSESPHRFGEDRFVGQTALVIPRVSSERRDYIPIDFVSETIIVIDSAQAIYNPELWIFSVISCRMHMIWVRTVCGSLESRIRYSSALGYNTFPFPPITEAQKKIMEHYVDQVLQERERHPEKTLAQLYDPEKMPAGLREAHYQLDLAIERCYRSRPFETDDERLEHLFQLYEQMIEEEKNRGTLFEGMSKPKAKRKKK